VTTLEGEKILITGPTSQVAKPVAQALAKDNEVWGVARFSDAKAKAALESAGVRCVTADLAAGDFSAVPADVSYVLNFAVARTGDFDYDLAANSEALGLLMSRCSGARALLHCSSTAVYQPDGHHRFAEDDPLGDNHRVMMPTYSIAKICAESMARYVARQHGIPTTIARLNVPYGNNGGWPYYHLEMMLAKMDIPVHPDAPCLYNPIHEDDIIREIPALLAAASVPATVVNWGGDEEVSIEEWCAYLGELVGVEPHLVPSDEALESVAIDTTKQHELLGHTTVGWKDGFRRLVERFHPELLKA